MNKTLFFDEVEDDISFKTNNEYAQKYNTWREKEELHRLQTKYGESASLGGKIGEDESSSSDDDEGAVEFTESVEKEFYKTLSLLKNKDPKIYDKNVTFFEDINKAEGKQQIKSKKREKPVYINDYERNLLLEKGAEFSDSENECNEQMRNYSPTYVEEQQNLKESFKNALNSDNEEEENWGGIFQKRQKSNEEKKKEEEDYKKWLKGHTEDIDDKDTEEQLKPLKEYWSDPKLDRNEQFLRDYILNKRFLDENDGDHIPTYEEIVHDSDENLSEDEKAIEEQEEFEHKYNFRFEEPDQEFIKRYPRTMENSLRKKDDRRKLKRVEIKERKEEEKKQKQEELKQLKAMKRKEIEEKIEKLREITGDANLGFKDDDINEDFDPESYDKRMQELFNNDYYKDEEIQKPECPDVDQELEIENWDKWHKEQNEQDSNDLGGQSSKEAALPHCEDDNFNMDCDYDPAAMQQELIDNCSNKKKRRNRQSKFSKAVTAKKPIFDPNDKSYEQYLDEYYKLDYEDMIDNIPCRFKYRSVVPNDFGLSVEEILMANDRELNKWCSLKKAIQHRPDDVEKYEVIAYKKKGENIDLKRKALPSLFKVDDNEDVADLNIEFNADNSTEEIATCSTNKSEDSKSNTDNKVGKSNDDESVAEQKTKSTVTVKTTAKKVNARPKGTTKCEIATEAATEPDLSLSTSGSSFTKTASKKRTNPNGNSPNAGADSKKQKVDANGKYKKTRRSKKYKGPKKCDDKNNEDKVSISNARLEAFGINPKKYKNKIKYGAKKQ